MLKHGCHDSPLPNVLNGTCRRRREKENTIPRRRGEQAVLYDSRLCPSETPSLLVNDLYTGTRWMAARPAEQKDLIIGPLHVCQHS